MEIQSECNGNVLGMKWRCGSGSAMGMEWKCNVNVIKM